jgi:hypothetical protein
MNGSGEPVLKVSIAVGAKFIATVLFRFPTESRDSVLPAMSNEIRTDFPIGIPPELLLVFTFSSTYRSRRNLNSQVTSFPLRESSKEEALPGV